VQNERCGLVKRICPPLASACANVGSPQVRNVGTIGGNMAKASPAADSVTAVIAVDGSVILASKNKTERRIPACGFLKGAYQIDIARDELITGIFVPKMDRYHWGFSKLGRRKASAIFLFTCVIGVKIAPDGVIDDARVALGAAAPNPFRCKPLENILIGSNAKDGVTQKLLDCAMGEVIKSVGSRPEMPYKRDSIGGVITETYRQALSQGGY